MTNYYLLLSDTCDTNYNVVPIHYCDHKVQYLPNSVSDRSIACNGASTTVLQLVLIWEFKYSIFIPCFIALFLHCTIKNTGRRGDFLDTAFLVKNLFTIIVLNL